MRPHNRPALLDEPSVRDANDYSIAPVEVFIDDAWSIAEKGPLTPHQTKKYIYASASWALTSDSRRSPGGNQPAESVGMPVHLIPRY